MKKIIMVVVVLLFGFLQGCKKDIFHKKITGKWCPVASSGDCFEFSEYGDFYTIYNNTTTLYGEYKVLDHKVFIIFTTSGGWQEIGNYKGGKFTLIIKPITEIKYYRVK
ncbi:MAG: hypothetical protein MUO21_00335 [Nitrososphaeraceae archaeon]|nr:hypothetical protein [Nitrososphaeraceae archaeon]